MPLTARPILLAGTLVLAAAAGGAAAQELGSSEGFWDDSDPVVASTHGPVRLQGSIGIMSLQANEYVYSGNYTVSHLIWDTMAPVLRGSISIDVIDRLSVGAEGSIAALGRSYMEDYDWLAGDDTFANWTDRSQHPDTRLDHYWTGAVSLGYEVVRAEDASVRLRAGLKYTDVKWNAYGGSYIYSVSGFRDSAGSFPAGTPGISYQQQFPEVFVGVDGEQTYANNLRVGAMLRGGLTVQASATDDHWQRNLRFVDSLDIAATVAAGVDVGYKISDMAEIVVAARYEQIFQQRGTTRTYDQTTGALVSVSPATGAGELRTLELSAGLHGSF